MFLERSLFYFSYDTLFCNPTPTLWSLPRWIWCHLALFYFISLFSVLQSLALCRRFSGVQYACERWTHSCDVHLFFCSPVRTQWKDNMAYGVCQKEEWEVWGKRRAPVELYIQESTVCLVEISLLLYLGVLFQVCLCWCWSCCALYTSFNSLWVYNRTLFVVIIYSENIIIYSFIHLSLNTITMHQLAKK